LARIADGGDAMDPDRRADALSMLDRSLAYVTLLRVV
jgi:hypothetical protein